MQQFSRNADNRTNVFKRDEGEPKWFAKPAISLVHNNIVPNHRRWKAVSAAPKPPRTVQTYCTLYRQDILSNTSTNGSILPKTTVILATT